MFQIELQEQRSSGRGSKSKDSKRKKRTWKPKASLNPQRLLNARRRNLQIHTQVHTAVRHTFIYFQMSLIRNKHTCSSLTDVVMISWSCGGRTMWTREPQRQKNAGLRLISPHNKLTYVFSTHQVDTILTTALFPVLPLCLCSHPSSWTVHWRRRQISVLLGEG